MELTAKINARLLSFCKGFATAAFLLAVIGAASEWTWRQLSGQNVQHAWLEPVGALFAIAAMFAVAATAGRPVMSLRASGFRLLGLLFVAGAFIGSIFILDWHAAHSAFQNIYTLQIPMGFLALAAAIALLRALRVRPAQRSSAPKRQPNNVR